MIWFSLALFAVSFVLTALLAPTPDIENARPESLDPENFPRATEDSPVPLVLGCGKVSGPNTLYYGDFRSEPIVEKIKVNIFKSKRVTVGYKYYLTLDMGICLGPGAELKKIYLDSEEVVSGDEVTEDNFQDVLTDGAPPIGTGSNIEYGSTNLKVIIETELGYTITDEQLDDIIAQGLITITFTLTYRFFSGIDNSDATGQSDMGITFYRSPNRTNPIPVEGGFVGDGNTYYKTGDGISGTHTLTLDNIPVEVGTRFIYYGLRLLPFFNLINDYEVTNSVFSIKFAGAVYESSTFDIFAPELYGGEKSGGGHVGNVTFYAGNFDQPVDPQIEASAGVGNVPAYRGMCHIAMPDQYIGETPQLRKLEFLIGKYSDLLGFGNKGRVGETEDINPAEAIYYLMTSSWAGLDVPTNQINITSFQEAGAVLESELNGCSIVVSTSKQGKDIINEILRQIDGVLVQSDNNLVELKLIRDDYVVGDLNTYDENDIVEISGYTKTAWEDVRTHVKLSFATRDKDTSRIAEAQNMATYGMIGRKNTAEISMPFCYDPDLANRLAHRELAQLSTPLLRMTLKMNRNGFQIRTGDVFKVDWPEYGITSLVVRAQKVNLGELNSNIVEIEVVQDIFAINTVVFGPPENTGWTNNRQSPAIAVENVMVEMPRFFQTKLDEPISDGFGSLIPFTIRPQTNSTSFDIVIGTATGVLDVNDFDNVLYPMSGIITADYGRLEGFANGLDTTTGLIISEVTGLLGAEPESSSAIDIESGNSGLLYMNGEWLGYTTVTDNLDGTYTLENIYRALLGTMPLDHLTGDRVFFFSTDLLDVSTIGSDLTEEGTAFYKVLDRIGATLADPADVTEESVTLTAQADRPLRPRNLQLDGSRTLPITVSATNADLTWVPSNRESTQIPFETDGAEIPDISENYNVEVYINGTLDPTLGANGVTSPYTIPFSTATLTGGENNEVRVYAVRTVGDLRVSSSYAILPFSIQADDLLLSGDEQSGTDKILYSGDAQTGTDIEELSGDEA